MSKALNISLLIIIQIAYFFAYIKLDAGNTEEKQFTYLFFSIWIIFVCANTYILYHLFPMMKNYIKSKNILVEIVYFIVCLLLGAAITNSPTEFILVPLIIN